MKIQKAGSQPSGQGPSEWFTGRVRIDPLFPVEARLRMAGNFVTFEPGAHRLAHHPAGQTLVVTSGTGWVQEQGGEQRAIGPGDVVWTASGVEHWHGATATPSMRHIAIQDVVDGSAATWLEQVTDEQYGG